MKSNVSNFLTGNNESYFALDFHYGKILELTEK